MTRMLTRRALIAPGVLVGALDVSGRVELVAGKTAVPDGPEVYEVALFDVGEGGGTVAAAFSPPIVLLQITGREWNACERAGCPVHEVMLAPRLPARFRPQAVVDDHYVNLDDGRVMFDALAQVLSLNFLQLRRMLQDDVDYDCLCRGLAFAEQYAGPFEVDGDNWGAFVGQVLLLSGQAPTDAALAFRAGQDVAEHLTESVWARFREVASRGLADSGRPPTAWEFGVALRGYGRDQRQAWRDAVQSFTGDPGEPHTALIRSEDSARSLQEELQALFLESLDAWTGEEDSVRAERADLISRMNSLSRRLSEAARAAAASPPESTQPQRPERQAGG
jgi:hypothetical protein